MIDELKAFVADGIDAWQRDVASNWRAAIPNRSSVIAACQTLRKFSAEVTR